MCGASSAQNQLQQQQSAFYQQMTAQATAQFGQQSSIYNDLVNTFAPTVAAGPDQQGFSAQELANQNSQAITQTGQSYKNLKQALGDQQASAVGAAGAGAVGPGGATTGADLALGESAANQTASQLSTITANNYATGRANYLNATQGLAGAGNVYGSANSTAGTSIGAGQAAGTTANQIAQANNSWVQGLTGALGGVVGAAAGNPAGWASAVGSLAGGGSSSGNAPGTYTSSDGGAYPNYS